MGDDANGRRKSKVSAMTIASALAFATINHAESHLDNLPPRQGNEPLGIDGIRAFTPRLRQANWPNGFSPKGIKTYDEDRDPEAWLRVYTTAIKAAGGSQNAMANYLSVILSPTVQDWLTGLPANSISSWGDLCAKFINNFQGTFTKPRVEWDLYQIHQKKGESLLDRKSVV